MIALPKSETPFPAIRGVSTVANIIAGAQAVHGLVERGRQHWRNRTQYTTTIDSRDDLFRPVLIAVLQSLPESDRRAVEAVTARSNEPIAVADDGRPSPARRVSWIYEGSRHSDLTIAGHRIQVAVEDATELKLGEMTFSRRQLKFLSPSLAARDALHQWIVDLAEVQRHERPAMRIASRWGGGWEYRGDLPSRDLSTVILDSDQKETIVADLERFLAAESAYTRLGVPYHRSYLLHGPTGTGKTSLAKALAAEYSLPLYYLPLSDMAQDAGLLQLVSQVPAQSMLLIEDIDIARAATERDDAHKGASLSALLNALDGVFTPHGLITVMTTNDVDKLDEALKRPGRVDLSAELGPCTPDMIRGLWDVAFDDPPPHGMHIDRAEGQTPAQVIGTIQANLDNPWRCAQILSGRTFRREPAAVGTA